MKITIKDIVYIGLLSALTAIATFIHVPTGFAMVHLGSAALFTVSLLFGGIYGGLAGAIGSAFFDLVAGYSQYTVFSIVIKGLAGLIVGYIAVGMYPPTRITPKANFVRIIFALIVGTIWTALGYYVAWWVVLKSALVAYGNIPFSLLTSGVGIIVAIILVPQLQNIVRNMNHKE